MLRTLVAEDDDLSFAVLGALLSRSTSPVVLYRAVSGHDVCHQYLTNPSGFDLILMDVEMPDMTGLRAAEIIRSSESTSRLRPILIVALTGHEDDETMESAFKVKIDIILRKPTKLPELEAVLRHALHYRSLTMSPGTAPAMTPSAAFGRSTASHLRYGVDAGVEAAVSSVRQHLWMDLLRTVSEIPIALDLKCSASLRHIASSIKVIGAHLDLPRVIELGRGIQEAAQDHRWEDSRSLASNLLAFIRSSPPEPPRGALLSAPTSSCSGGSAPSPSPPCSPRLSMEVPPTALSLGAALAALSEHTAGAQRSPGREPLPLATPLGSLSVAAAAAASSTPGSVSWGVSSPNSVIDRPIALRLSAADSVVTSLRLRGQVELRAHLDRLNIDLAQGDFISIARIGHILKGVGSNLGHSHISELGHSLKIASLECDTERLRTLVLDFAAYLHTVGETDPTSSLASALSELTTVDGKEVSQPKRACGPGRPASPVGNSGHQLMDMVSLMSVAVDFADYGALTKHAEQLRYQAGNDQMLLALARRIIDAAERRQLSELLTVVHELEYLASDTQKNLAF